LKEKTIAKIPKNILILSSDKKLNQKNPSNMPTAAAGKRINRF
jgi:hypothetical protein